ncbi:helix-turn-helix domain-containing protein [Cupriavidus basilensis]|uniref:helix-turn-helix domain-containing protein n=1 Tax=Cupriavidus basilensis TaxID=68895 RepID=UPI0018CCFF45|nr:XRE family transcriptional regulator [Cupriavidus basilensis]
MSLNKKIRALRLQKNMTLQQVADVFGITRSAVSSWERGDTRPDQDKLMRLGKIFGISVENLLNSISVAEDTDSRINFAINTSLGLPLIPITEAARWRETMAGKSEDATLERIPCPFPHSPSAFITTVPGQSMFDPSGSKSYSEGDFIAVDPARPIANGCMVLVHKKSTDEVIFRQILIEGTRKMIQPLNKRWPDQIDTLGDEDIVIGVIIGKWVPE